MPPKSIYLPEEMIQSIQDQMDESQSFSEWIQMAIDRELEAEYDDLEDLKDDVESLSNEIQEIQDWRTEIMEEIVDWFKGEFGPAE